VRLEGGAIIFIGEYQVEVRIRLLNQDLEIAEAVLRLGTIWTSGRSLPYSRIRSLRYSASMHHLGKPVHAHPAIEKGLVYRNAFAVTEKLPLWRARLYLIS
jgi:hypothetical protein